MSGGTPKRFGKYVLGEVLGEGGMGRVYHARDSSLDRSIALKVLLPDAALVEEAAREAVTRMIREARAVARLEHPNIVTVYELGEVDGTPYIAMELVRGKSLRSFVGDASVSFDRRSSWLTGVARALGAAHARGIIHRDVKPENVLVREDDVVKVVDFGIARLLASSELEVDPAASTVSPAITAEGNVLGTPKYMSPEQLWGAQVTAASDQFSWAVLAYELIAGKLPWGDARSSATLVTAILHAAPLPLAHPELAPHRERAVMRALSKKPEDRFPDMSALLAEWTRSETQPSNVAAPDPPPSPRAPPAKRARWLVVAGAAVAALVALAVVRPWESKAPILAIAPRPGPAPSDMGFSIHDATPPRGKPAAVEAYGFALRAFHAGNWRDARKHLIEAVTLDPSLGAAHVRLALIDQEQLATSGRQAYRAASDLSADLSDRDRDLLHALEPVFGDPPKFEESRERFRRLADARPFDAEMIAIAANEVEDPADKLRFSDRVLAIDDRYADAWQSRATALWALGRLADARAAVDRCVAVNPGGRDCRLERVMHAAATGDCEAMEVDAREVLARFPGHAHAAMAQAMVAMGRPRSAIETVMAQEAVQMPPERRPYAEPLVKALLHVHYGEMSAAEAQLDVAARAVAGWRDGEPHAWIATHRIHIAKERGDFAAARKVARAYLEARSAWTPPQRDPYPFILSVGGGDGAAEKRDLYVASHARDTAAARRFFWAAAHFGFVKDEASANAALASRPDAAITAAYDTRRVIFAAIEARILLLAKRTDEALPLVQMAAKSCLHLVDPFVHTWAQGWLGDALEVKGDKPGACAAFSRVVARWGDALPRSLTAAHAKERIAALACTR